MRFAKKEHHEDMQTRQSTPFSMKLQMGANSKISGARALHFMDAPTRNVKQCSVLLLAAELFSMRRRVYVLVDYL